MLFVKHERSPFLAGSWHFPPKNKTEPKNRLCLFWVETEALCRALPRFALRSGYKLRSAPDGRYISEILCFACSLHMTSHPNYLHQK